MAEAGYRGVRYDGMELGPGNVLQADGKELRDAAKDHEDANGEVDHAAMRDEQANVSIKVPRNLAMETAVIARARARNAGARQKRRVLAAAWSYV